MFKSSAIKAKREFLGLSQQELGDKLNVSQKTISSWESGRTEPNMAMVQKICDILSLDFDILLPSERKKEDLSGDENTILKLYRNADESTKEMVRRILIYAKKFNDKE